jgi:hypothetical protein
LVSASISLLPPVSLNSTSRLTAVPVSRITPL